MSILANKRQKKEDRLAARKWMLVYLGISMFCLVFYLIYNQFSHGVHSVYMTWLFAWPLLLGVLPSMVFWYIPKIHMPGRVTVNLYHSGVAAVTISSLLRGILEIAGTISIHQQRLMYAGGIMLVSGMASFCLEGKKNDKNTTYIKKI